MCRWMAWFGEPVLMEEPLFKTQHGLVDQSLHSRLGAATTNGDGIGVGWYGGGEGPAVYRNVSPAWGDTNLRELAAHVESPRRELMISLDANLFAAVQGSTDAEAVKRLHPDNERLRRVRDGDRVIVSEPFSDLSGLWIEIPEATAVTVHRGGAMEQAEFRPAHMPAAVA